MILNVEHQTRFNFTDVLWSPARALSAKQILVMTVFLLGGLAVYDSFYYLAVSLDSQPAGSAFRAYGFFPFILASFRSWFPTIVYYLGVAGGVISVMLGFFAVAAINVESIRGNRFFSARGAIRFAFKRLPQLLLAELSISLFVGFIVFLFFLLGLVSRLPFIGDWVYTILFTLPNFVIAMFSVFLIFVLILSILLLPAVAAAERQGETFSAILETYSTMIRQPFRWAGYTAYSIVAAKVCSFIYAYFAFRAVQFMVVASGLGGGDRLGRLVESGMAHLPVRSEFVTGMFNIFPGIDFGVNLLPYVRAGSHDAVSILMAFMLVLIFASIVGYFGAILASAQARTFVVIRYIKDGYNIVEEEPLFFTDEHVNPEIETKESETTEPGGGSE